MPNNFPNTSHCQKKIAKKKKKEDKQEKLEVSKIIKTHYMGRNKGEN